LLGTPAVSVPGMTGESGMPVGVQLVGRLGADSALLGMAAWAFEVLQAPGYRSRRAKPETAAAPTSPR
jgi:Asp-tRNA(Asn)/Glu-tRNA(Gln) amidotransferase A subunit family amidase